jgi:sulfoxide reductase heme-binding subunit YedZ
MTEHVFWITSRAAGVVALLAASLAVALGLLMGTPLRRRIPETRALHEALSLATMLALVVHAAALLGDGYFEASLADITIPFVRGFWMGLGIVAGWLFVILGLSYYLRARIGPARWRSLHRFTALAWVLGVAHAVMLGTDAGTVWFLVAATLVVVPAAALLARRRLGEVAT